MYISFLIPMTMSKNSAATTDLPMLKVNALTVSDADVCATKAVPQMRAVMSNIRLPFTFFIMISS